MLTEIHDLSYWLLPKRPWTTLVLYSVRINPMYNNITVCLDLPQICVPEWTQSSLLYFILMKHSASVNLKYQWTTQKKPVIYCICTDTLPKNQLNGSLLTLVDSSSFLMVTKDFLSSAPSVSSWHNSISNTLSLFWAPSAAWLVVSVGAAEVSPCDSLGISALFSLADGHVSVKSFIEEIVT